MKDIWTEGGKSWCGVVSRGGFLSRKSTVDDLDLYVPAEPSNFKPRSQNKPEHGL